MVLFVRWFLVLPLLVAVATPAHAANRTTAPYLRTSLDEAMPPTASPRVIRSSLDEPRRHVSLDEGPSHAVFPLEEGAARGTGRLIRLSLDDGQVTYGRLVLAQPRARHIRTSLD